MYHSWLLILDKNVNIIINEMILDWIGEFIVTTSKKEKKKKVRQYSYKTERVEKQRKWTMGIQSLKGTSKVVGAKVCRQVIGI